jgi:uncharacterized protein with PQ loop repeat
MIIMANNRYRKIRAEWRAVKKITGPFGFGVLIAAMVLWLVFGILTLYQTINTTFTPAEAVIFSDTIFFIYGLALTVFLYILVLKIKNKGLKLK